MKKQKVINIFDLGVVLAAIIIVVALGVGFYQSKKAPVDSQKVLLTISVTSDKTSILPLLTGSSKVYFDSLNTAVDFVSYDNSDGLKITLSAPGSTKNGVYYFNGQRVLVGQKAEIHGSYYAKGIITEVKNAN